MSPALLRIAQNNATLGVLLSSVTAYFYSGATLSSVKSWIPGTENFLCVWGEQETVKILDLHNPRLLDRRKQSHETMHKINSLLSVRQGESCLFKKTSSPSATASSPSSSATSPAGHNSIHVLSFLIVTRCSNVDVPDQLVAIEICLDQGEGDFEMNAPPHYVEGSSEAKKLFQIVDTHQFLLWQRGSPPSDKHPPSDVISVWIAKLEDIAHSCSSQQHQQPKAVRLREKDVRVSDLISGKETGGVNKVVFHSYPD
ncbi:uncharacterized protein LOC142357368, partial [Convolutriloba macropyga]|uniref:uncharacterized protein LOC142357368 n=1 Tax=Convolutriloba macropyga TaxID=536237 RepID=UPI003F5221B1